MTALATLEIEGCGLTTRTFQQISSSLHPDSSLVKLCVGEWKLMQARCQLLAQMAYLHIFLLLTSKLEIEIGLGIEYERPSQPKQEKMDRGWMF